RYEGLVPVALQRRDGVEHPLGAPRLAGGPLPVDRIEEVEDPPALRRNDGVHSPGGYPPPRANPGRCPQLAFVYRDTAEKERQLGGRLGSRATGVRLPGYGGKGT